MGGGYIGFWNAILIHIFTLPFDIIVLLAVSIWGSLVLNQEGTERCSEDALCSPFIGPMHLTVVIGYSYIILSLFLKPLLLGLFCFCCGLQWMKQDELEEKDWNIQKVRGRVVSGLRSGTFSSIYGAVRGSEASTLAGSAMECCPICLQDIGGEERVSVLNCHERHMGHADCINDHLMHSMQCPICRQRQDIDAAPAAQQSEAEARCN